MGGPPGPLALHNMEATPGEEMTKVQRGNVTPDHIIAGMRMDWESGMSINKVSKKWDVSPPTVTKYRDRQGWTRKDETPEPVVSVDPEPETETVAAPATFERPFVDDQFDNSPVPPEPDTQLRDMLAEQEAKVARLEKELAEKTAEAERLDPKAHVATYTTPDEVLAAFGEAQLEEMVDQELAQENLDRYKKGLPQYDFSTQPHLKEQVKRRLLQEALDNRTKHVTGTHNVRNLKMVRPDGNLVQVPVEEQTDNEAGQQGTAVWKAREKGFKIAEPYLCQTLNCWLPAPRDGQNRFVYDGYCSVEHRATDPYLDARTVAGVTTSRQVWS